MFSSQNLLPDITEDISAPTLSNRFRLLVLPQGLQRMVLRKNYRTRGSLAGGNIIGNLRGFVDLPMDIAFEIAMYLSPKDLLHLSQLSKQFRSIFASRSAIVVWHTAFRYSHIHCLTDLNELQFASFIYDKYCMACGSMTMKCTKFPMLRLRLCPGCQKTNLTSIEVLQNRYPDAKDLICHIPASSAQCFTPEAKLLIEKFLSLKSENSIKFIANVEQHMKARHADTLQILPLITPKGHTKQTCQGYRIGR